MTSYRWAFALALVVAPARADDPAPARADTAPWALSAPIVTYWAGPGYGGRPLDDAAAARLVEGGWTMAWAQDTELDVAARHGLRALLTHPLLGPATLDDPAQRARLDALVDRVKSHPALEAYFIVDEPPASRFAELGRLVAYLRERDPAHFSYINLLPTYATNEQLGTTGDKVAAYNEHLRQFVETVRPALLSYDHYQFAAGHDMDDYFLNLALVRRRALDSDLPFLNIVQACTWTPSMREPTEDEMRYLVHTSLAYGAQGISYYVYSYPGHTPGIVRVEDGAPTPVFGWLRTLNREFTAIAQQLRGLTSRGVFHAGMMPPGATALPTDAQGFRFDPPLPDAAFQPGERVRGVLLGTFGPRGASAGAGDVSTHAMVVNLDTKAPATVTVTVRGTGPLDQFDPSTGQWRAIPGDRAALSLPPGGGQLLRPRP